MKKKNLIKQTFAFAGLIVIGCFASQAFAISIDLSGATTGSTITAPGGSFAQSFLGQTVSGTTLVGDPSGPLTLKAGGSLDVAFFNGFNTILPQPNNQAPLALLLSQQADAISWVMGFADGGDFLTIKFYDNSGNTVHSVSQLLTAGYSSYSFSGFGAFAGLAISDDNDGAGLRYYNFQYDAASVASVPDSGSSVVLMLLGMPFLIAFNRRFKLADA